MPQTCDACGRTCGTRYEWAHHGCEVSGVGREANRQAPAPPPVPPAEATEPRGGDHRMPGSSAPSAVGPRRDRRPVQPHGLAPSPEDGSAAPADARQNEGAGRLGHPR